MRVLSERPSVRFSELFAGVTSRSEVVATFLALLELIRLKQLTACSANRSARLRSAGRARPGPARAGRRRGSGPATGGKRLALD